ncbi:hypothetical protein D7Y41_04145 [Anaerotruncus sp. 1XD22-93]|nr:hypothetical protein D7Y41_04145 [Anaerotruncus sp. 1XD22-93]
MVFPIKIIAFQALGSYFFSYLLKTHSLLPIKSSEIFIFSLIYVQYVKKMWIPTVHRLRENKKGCILLSWCRSQKALSGRF